jgi:hypothetical protein
VFLLFVKAVVGSALLLQAGVVRLVVVSTRKPAGYAGHDTVALVLDLAMLKPGVINAHASA